MLTPQLLTYITQQLDRGIDKETMKKALLSAGWQEGDINSAFSAIESQTVSPDKSPPAPDADSKDFSHYFSQPKISGKGGWKAIHYYEETNSPKIVQWLMKYSGGMIKTERQATIAASAFIIVCMAASFWFLYQSLGSGSSVKMTPEFQKRLKNCKPPECVL